MSQLAPKYPWRQRHSLGLRHTSFSLQVKLPSQRALVNKQRARLVHCLAKWPIRHIINAITLVHTCQAFISELCPSTAAHKSWWSGKEVNTRQKERAMKEASQNSIKQTQNCNIHTQTLSDLTALTDVASLFRRLHNTCAKHVVVCIFIKNEIFQISIQDVMYTKKTQPLIFY